MQNNKRRGYARREFIENAEAIQALLDEGHTIITAHEELIERGVITMGYATFARYIKDGFTTVKSAVAPRPVVRNTYVPIPKPKPKKIEKKVSDVTEFDKRKRSNSAKEFGVEPDSMDDLLT